MKQLFTVQSSEELGRYGVAMNNITANDVILDEFPFAYGPKQGSSIICLGCFSPVETTCLICKWPLCIKCIGTKIHEEECKVFSSGKVIFHGALDSKGSCPQLDCITPLRTLLKIEANPEEWTKLIEPMEYHDGPRRESQDTWNADLINIAKYLRGPCKLKQFSEEMIMRVIGILQVNAFEAKTPQGYPVRCVFPLTAILAHNCVPNTTRSIYPSEGFRIKLRALVDIKKGDQIFVSYTYTMSGTAERQAHLKSGKFFTCRCERCLDPTELGTYFSSLKCMKCSTGYVTVTNPFDDSNIWKCSSCEFITSSASIKEILNPIQCELDAVESMPFGQQRLEIMERIHRKYNSILHPFHFIQMNMRQHLIEMYGRIKGYELKNLPTFLLEYKEEMCRNVLKILNIFEPGMSRSRAMLLYELHAPIALCAQKMYLDNLIDKKEYEERIHEAIKILEECVSILEMEDPVSHEGLLAAVGKSSLEQLKENVKQNC